MYKVLTNENVSEKGHRLSRLVVMERDLKRGDVQVCAHVQQKKLEYVQTYIENDLITMHDRAATKAEREKAAFMIQQYVAKGDIELHYDRRSWFEKLTFSTKRPYVVIKSQPNRLFADIIITNDAAARDWERSLKTMMYRKKGVQGLNNKKHRFCR